MADDVRVLNTTEEQRPDPATSRYRLCMVTRFMVGADGPFSVSQPEDGFDPAAQAQLVQDKANAVRAARAAAGG